MIDVRADQRCIAACALGALSPPPPPPAQLAPLPSHPYPCPPPAQGLALFVRAVALGAESAGVGLCSAEVLTLLKQSPAAADCGAGQGRVVPGAPPQCG